MMYVFSTFTNDSYFCDYDTSDKNRIPILKHQVLIKGGTGRAKKGLITPLGVMTRVSQDDYDFLLQNDGFVKAMKDGFITSRKSECDPEVMAADMELRDGASPLLPGDKIPGLHNPVIAAEEGSQGIIEKIVNKMRAA